jgi:hypothetical protein
MANCPHCQAKLPDDAKECPRCGGDVSWWLQRDRQVYGPYDLTTVRFILQDDRVTAEDLARIGDDGEWQALGALLHGSIDVAQQVSRDGGADQEGKYRTWSATRWIVYVGVFLLLCAGTAVAIVWPAWSQIARERTAEDATSKLEQIGLALELYAYEHDGRLPEPGRWEQAVAQYLADPETYHTGAGGNDTSYWYNEQLAGGKPSEWDNCSKLVMAAERGAFDEPAGTPPRPEGFLYLYADGHVAAHRSEESIGDLQPRGWHEE